MSHEYINAQIADPFRGMSTPAQLMPADLVSLSPTTQPLQSFFDEETPESRSWWNRIIRKVTRMLLGQSIESAHHELLEKYQIEIFDDQLFRVRFTIPMGCSRLELLRDTQAFSMMLDEPRVYATAIVLKNWQQIPQFCTPVAEDVTQTIDGNVENSTHLNDMEQRRCGLNNVSMSSLAAAHAAYYIATGTDLFCGNAVRSRDHVLVFRDVTGLAFDNSRSKYEQSPTLAASRDIS